MLSNKDNMNWYIVAKKHEMVGKSKEEGVSRKDVSPSELKSGIEVEKEHTKDDKMAERIALDHLAEIPDYYTRLKKMEDEAFAEMKKQ